LERLTDEELRELLWIDTWAPGSEHIDSDVLRRSLYANGLIEPKRHLIDIWTRRERVWWHLTSKGEHILQSETVRAIWLLHRCASITCGMMWKRISILPQEQLGSLLAHPSHAIRKFATLRMGELHETR
jgi:hypothetical protein